MSSTKRFLSVAMAALVMAVAAGCGGGDNGGGGGSGAGGGGSGPLTVDCSGAGCGATSSTSYSGAGVGAWRYTNAGSAAASVNINITMPALAAGKTATLVFSNGSQLSTALPVSGVATDLANHPVIDMARIVPFAQSDADREAALHAAMTERNRQVSAALPLLAAANPPPLQPSARSLELLAQNAEVPAVGASRSWIEAMGTPTTYSATVEKVCDLPSGRKVVFWLDPNAKAAGLVTSANIDTMAAAVCGANQGFARMNSLLGDFWGTPSAANAATLIPETGGALQNINIVIPNVPASGGWAGYFYGANNFLKTTADCPVCSTSNEALVFFISPHQIKSDLNFATSTLLHEATHMLNFYQRRVARGLSGHDTWLEETSAMMTEDIISPAVQGGYHKIGEYRLPSYLKTGGAVSYINWPKLNDASGNYGIAGAFGAYLNRRFGLGIYKDLVAACQRGEASYACLNRLIVKYGGQRFDDEFAHFGAALFAALPAAGAPAKYGFPAKTEGIYTLPVIDVSGYQKYRPTIAASLGSEFRATTHSYVIDGLPAGKTSYARNGVAVPANTTLLLVIQ